MGCLCCYPFTSEAFYVYQACSVKQFNNKTTEMHVYCFNLHIYMAFHTKTEPLFCQILNKTETIKLCKIKGNSIKHLKVDGNWGAWTQWGTCTVTCGNGTRTRTAQCNSPPPQFGGAPCSGTGSDTGPCNIVSCPGLASIITNLTNTQ